MISPQVEATLTLTSKIGGIWNRFEAGNLLVVDDYGGFTVNPAIPLGSGRLTRTSIITPALDFANRINDLNFLSKATPGWQISWTVSPGERIALSTFPPRPYDWDKSFNTRTMLTFALLPTSVYTAEYSPASFDIAILWDFSLRGYGLSYGQTLPAVNDAVVKSHIAAIKAQGMSPISYMSAYFYYSRDPQEFINEVIRWRDQYGLEGIYTDGLPSQEWIVAYEEMRMLREAFPAGNLYVHTTGQSINGGPPLALPDIFMPFIDTYATATVRGEWVLGKGQNWAYQRYITSQFKKSNTIGIEKGDRWNIPESKQDDISLFYNGRTWFRSGPYNPTELNYWNNVYLPKLAALKQDWKQRGNLPNYFGNYYRPKVRQLTGLDMGLNLIINSGFEGYTGLSKLPNFWTTQSFSTLDGKSTVRKIGAYAIKINGAPAKTKTLTQTKYFSGYAGDLLTFSYWIKGNSIPVANGKCMGQIFLYNGAILKSTKTLPCPTGTYEFAQQKITISSPSVYTRAVIQFTFSKPSGAAWIDTVSLTR